MEIKQGTAIVTGSATGLGAAIAKRLASKGCNVVINYTRSEADAEETAAACENLGVEALLCRADVANDADCRRMAALSMEKWGRIDALVNNAGVTKFTPAEDLESLSAEDFQHMYAVNVVGPYQMIRAVAPHMKRGGRGAVVNISTIAAITGDGSSVAYAASKGALNVMTLSLARALGPEIRVNAICPGFVQTRWNRDGMGEKAYGERVVQMERMTPLQTANTPEEIAETAVWLVEGGDCVTGEIILADSGLHLVSAPLSSR
ncbi:MAG: SDR family oxidoreductase [Rhodospirillales bacterium]|jgi:3-oxoacyl-[acyl-carrier protein] reductase|nr:SDR family oxidoreductase [Rhodospirillales bacterium]MDP6774123.1 SDR family oxidoreductase [Rhodospirillales bacterium]